jgi:hypothetical protein
MRRSSAPSSRCSTAPPERLTLQHLELLNLCYEGCGVCVALPEVAKAAPRTMPPLAAIPVTPEFALAKLVPAESEEVSVPPAGLLGACAPRTPSGHTSIALRPHRHTRPEDAFIAAGGHNMDGERHGELSAPDGKGAARCKVGAMRPGRPRYFSNSRHSRPIPSSLRAIGVTISSFNHATASVEQLSVQVD